MSNMNLSISSLKLFKACRRAYQFKNIYRIIPVETSAALATGTSYHEMIETLHRDGSIPELNSKEAAMARAYATYIMPDMPEFEPEVWFEKKVGRCKTLIGRLDGKTENAIIEHKTTSVNSIDEYEFNLQMDEQLLAYFLATGCRNAFYTVCRKPTIRQKQSETDVEFAQRCYEWYSDDTYNKIRLLKVSRTDDEVEAFKQELIKMFKVIRTAAKNDEYYRNTCYCNAWGRPCEYSSICLNYDPTQEYVNFKKREDQY